MKQVIQSARTGQLDVKDVPRPSAAPGELLVATRASLISAGTERMVVDFARKSIAGKARARPDLVKKALGKARTDGIAATFRSVRARLDEPLPLGYSAVGVVTGIGGKRDSRGYRPGDRVAIAGAGIANHAEYNAVPENLAALVPANVPDEEACFGTVGAIALHAVRNLDAQIGETVAVIGAGLVGQLALRILRLSGARPVALDYDAGRLDLARQLGAEAAYDLNEWSADRLVMDIGQRTAGIGCDAILIAAATESAEPFETAAEIARDRARVCLVGLTGTGFPYAAFMKKELNIVVSRSYGPGRYDNDYEERNVKFPAGFVRWTETANLAEVLRLMALPEGQRLDVGKLISHSFGIGEAVRGFELVTDNSEPSLGVVITYPAETSAGTRAAASPRTAAVPASGTCAVGLIGAGAFARAVLLPELSKLQNVQLRSVAGKSGASAKHAAEKFGFEETAESAEAVIGDPSVNAVVIATRHDSHAALTAQALLAGKSVWVEKPLAISEDELALIEDALERSGGLLQVGFNRRFAPASVEIKHRLGEISGPRNIVARVNAGRLPADHWTLDPDAGGGRLIGEGCHFIDMARFFAGSPIEAVHASGVAMSDPAVDDVTATLQFADGGLATIVYTSLGDAGFPKEQIEVFAGGAVFVIDNFRSWQATVGGSTRQLGSGGQDKGHRDALKAFVAAVAGGGEPPVPAGELLEVSHAAVAADRARMSGQWIRL